LTGEVQECFEAGVIDSLKVTRLAVLHAASIAGMIVSTQAIVHRDVKYDAPGIETFRKELF
jgi:chaperonin GroEL (HSP60 family)